MIQRRSDGLVGDELRYSELDDALGLTAPAGDVLADAWTGKNGRHAPVGLLWQSVFGCLAGYENVNDAERPCGSGAFDVRYTLNSSAKSNVAGCPNLV